MRRIMSVLFAGVGACGNVEPNDTDAAVDVDAPSIDAAVDVDAPSARCNPSGAWQVAPLTSLNSAGAEGYAWFTDDLLTAYIGSDTGGGPGSWDIYRSTRASITADFPMRVVEQGVSTTADERGP